MSPKAKNIKIFLADGVPNGLMIAEIGNWVGKVLVIPRSGAMLQTLKDRPETSQTGVYVLSGVDPDAPSYREMVYIGESENVLTRLSQHLQDPKKEFWERTILIVSKDNNLTKAHVRYLEHRLISLASQAGRATVFNGNAGTPPKLPEGDTADMEAFLEEIQILLPVLSFPFALPVPKVTKSLPVTAAPIQLVSPSIIPVAEIVSSPVFVLNKASITAEAQEINGEFVVFKGSLARPKILLTSVSPRVFKRRAQLVENGLLVEHQAGQSFIFTADVPFTSPTYAADVVTGYSNTLSVWSVKGTGQTYKEWQAAQSAQVLNSSSDNLTDTD